MSGASRTVPWGEHFTALRKFKEQHGHCRVPTRYPENPALGLWLRHQRKRLKKGRLSGEQLELFQSLGVTNDLAIDRAAIRWHDGFQRLADFKKKAGHFRVAYTSWLGQWVQEVRRNARQGKLAPEQRRQLKGIGFEWEVINVAWEHNYLRLLEFQQRHGHYNVPFGDAFFRWVQQHRLEHRRGILPAGVVRRLDAIGFEWTKGRRTGPKLEAAWARNFKALLQFKRKHGHTRVSERKYGRRGLGAWVASLRQDYRAGQLSPERIARLERIGFVWHGDEHQWREQIKQLRRFKKEFGHPNVPVSYRDQSLAKFLANLRKSHQRGTLSPDRLRTLNKLGMTWNLKRQEHIRLGRIPKIKY